MAKKKTTRRRPAGDRAPENPVGPAERSVIGTPGRRTRPGRSGYDPVESRAEAGRWLGIVVRQLISGRLRISNPLAIAMLAVFGLLGIAPLLLALFEAARGDPLPLNAWLLIVPCGAAGILFLWNFIRTL